MKVMHTIYTFIVPQVFFDLLQKEIDKAGIKGDNGACIIFRDSSYSPETGGYHPVEIALDKEGKLLYITDFAYVGRPPMHELVKELDFDFSQDTFQMPGVFQKLHSARDMFVMWLSNFHAYYEMGAYDEISVKEGV